MVRVCWLVRHEVKKEVRMDQLLNLRIKAHDYDTTHDNYENGDDDNDIVTIITTTNNNNNNDDDGDDKKNKWPRVSTAIAIKLS